MEALLYGDPRDDREAERQLRRRTRADVRHRLRGRQAWWTSRSRQERVEEMVRFHSEDWRSSFQKWTDESMIDIIVMNELQHVLLLIDIAPGEVGAELERLLSRG